LLNVGAAVRRGLITVSSLAAAAVVATLKNRSQLRPLFASAMSNIFEPKMKSSILLTLLLLPISISSHKLKRSDSSYDQRTPFNESSRRAPSAPCCYGNAY
jgi:hypothetical protein